MSLDLEKYSLPEPWEQHYRFIDYTQYIDGYVEFRLPTTWEWPEEIRSTLREGGYTEKCSPDDSQCPYIRYEHAPSGRSVSYTEFHAHRVVEVKLVAGNRPIVSDGGIQDAVLSYLWHEHGGEIAGYRHVCAEDVGRGEGREPLWQDATSAKRVFDVLRGKTGRKTRFR